MTDCCSCVLVIFWDPYTPSLIALITDMVLMMWVLAQTKSSFLMMYMMGVDNSANNPPVGGFLMKSLRNAHHGAHKGCAPAAPHQRIMSYYPWAAKIQRWARMLILLLKREEDHWVLIDEKEMDGRAPLAISITSHVDRRSNFEIQFNYKQHLRITYSRQLTKQPLTMLLQKEIARHLLVIMVKATCKMMCWMGRMIWHLILIPFLFFPLRVRKAASLAMEIMVC